VQVQVLSIWGRCRGAEMAQRSMCRVVEVLQVQVVGAKVVLRWWSKGGVEQRWACRAEVVQSSEVLQTRWCR
jgi:hypothetical protein